MKEPIDSRQLHIFLMLATKGNLRSAAQELHITNSAVSHSIHVLENSLGTKLFHRPGKMLILTEQGRYLAQEAAVLLSHMDRIRSKLAGPVLDESATLRVAVGFTFLNRPLPDVVREWQQCFPKATLAAQAAERDACLHLVKNEAVDGAIVVDPPEDAELEQVPLFEDRLKVLMSSDNALSRSDALSIRNLHQKVLLVSRLQSHTTQRVLSEMRRRSLNFRDCVEVGSSQALGEMIKAGAGIAFMPEWAMPSASDDGGLVARDLEDVNITRKWAYVRSNQTPANFMSRTFLRLCQRVAERLS